MTPKEKAEKYDEALRRARKLKEDPTSVFYQYSPSEGDTIVDYIFPELKESEGERIRKAIISGMYALKEQYKTCFASIPIDDCIAWLEKQGDKDELIKELDEYKAKYTQEVLEKHLRAMNKNDERLRKTTIAFLKDFADKGYENAIECIDWLEKQGGITKLSEEEQNRFAKGVLTSCALSFINYLDAHKYHGKMCVSNGECEDIENAFHNAMWDRLHRYYCKYIEKQGEQKPQGKTALEAINEEKVDNQFCVKPVDKVEPKDYSSIDPHFFKPTDKIVEKYNITGIGSKHAQGKLGEMIKNLKSINERLEQKITSSKEDETSIAVNNPDAYKIGFADGEAHAKEEQWKPSDEQIKHLTYVVYDAKHKNRISTNGYEPYSYLYALLMQLKKLKG